MPTLPLTNEQCLEALEAVKRHHGSILRACAELDIPRGTFRHRLQTAKERGLGMSEGARRAVANAGLNGIEAKGGWIHNYDDEGKKTGTTRWVAEDIQTLEDVAERIRATLEGMEAAPVVPAPEISAKGLLGLHVIADVHMGASITKDEAGAEYNREIAKERLRSGFAHCAQALPACEVCVILYNGDSTHANDDKNRTPKSGHPLKVEGSHQSNLFALEEVIGWQVQAALEKHQRVVLVVRAGNHDPNTPAPLIMAMRAYWRDNSRVTVIDDENPYFVFRMGRVFFATHHGDGAAPAKRAQNLQHKYRQEYGLADFHWFFTGDKHHAKADTFGGVHWRQVPSVISLEQHSHAEGYADTSGMYAAWFDTETGRTSEVTIRF